MNEKEILKRILLNMKYDSKKTLSENRQFLNESESQNKVVLTKNLSNTPCGKNTDNSVWVSTKQLPNHWKYKYTEIDNYQGMEPGVEDKVQFFKRGDKKWSACFVMPSSCCKLYEFYSNYQEFDPDRSLRKKTQMLCLQTQQKNKENLDRYKKGKAELQHEMDFCGLAQHGFYVPELKIPYENGVIDFLEKSFPNIPTSETTNLKKNPISTKPISQQKVNIGFDKNDPQSHLKYPKDYAQSKGMNNWERYKQLFCCPKEGSIASKCNINIAQAIHDGWDENKPVPKNLSFCADKENGFEKPKGSDSEIPPPGSDKLDDFGSENAFILDT